MEGRYQLEPRVVLEGRGERAREVINCISEYWYICCMLFPTCCKQRGTSELGLLQGSACRDSIGAVYWCVSYGLGLWQSYEDTAGCLSEAGSISMVTNTRDSLNATGIICATWVSETATWTVEVLLSSNTCCVQFHTCHLPSGGWTMCDRR